MAKTEETIFSVKLDTGDSTAELKRFTDQLNTSKKTVDEFDDSIDKTSGMIEVNSKAVENSSKVIEDNSQSMVKQKAAMGGVSDSLNKLSPALGSAVSGIQSVTKAGLAFIATPLGLVIAAIALAFGSLVAYFKSSEEGQNKLNRITLIFSSTVEQLMNFVEDLGGALVAAFENPKQAMSDLYEFVKQNLINRFTAFKVILDGILELDFKKVSNGVVQAGTGVENAIDKIQAFSDKVKAAVEAGIKAGNDLSDLQEALNANERKLLISSATTNREVAKLKERALTEEGDTRKATVAKAIKLIQEQSDAEIAQKKRLEQQAIIEAKNNGDTIEAKLKIAQATAAVINAEAERYSEAFRLQKQFEALDAAELLRKQKEADELLALKAKNADAQWAEEVKRREDQNKQISDKALEDFKNEQKTEKAKQDLKTQTTKNELGLLAKLTKDKSAARVLGNALLQKDAIKETTINTYASAQAAFKALSGIPIVGPILGGIAFAAAIAKGLATVEKISGFAKGGKALSGTRISSGMGIPITRSNGDNLLATVRTGEVILNKDQQQKLGGSATFKSIGVPGFFDGGGTGGQYETRIAVNSSNNQAAAIESLAAALLTQRPIAFLQDFDIAKNTQQAPRNAALLIQG